MVQNRNIRDRMNKKITAIILAIVIIAGIGGIIAYQSIPALTKKSTPTPTPIAGDFVVTLLQSKAGKGFHVGTVTVYPSQATTTGVPANTLVTLAASGSGFSYWQTYVTFPNSAENDITTNPYTFSIQTNTQVQAFFNGAIVSPTPTPTTSSAP